MIKHESNNIEHAALFIYLNKCGFNGMYRENSTGKFNIPFGKMNNPCICDEKLLRNINNILQKININHCNYDNILKNINEFDFVYLDPPIHQRYSPLFKTHISKNNE
jgi:DNA adenine methylase